MFSVKTAKRPYKIFPSDIVDIRKSYDVTHKEPNLDDKYLINVIIDVFCTRTKEPIKNVILTHDLVVGDKRIEDFITIEIRERYLLAFAKLPSGTYVNVISTDNNDLFVELLEEYEDITIIKEEFLDFLYDIEYGSGVFPSHVPDLSVHLTLEDMFIKFIRDWEHERIKSDMLDYCMAKIKQVKSREFPLIYLCAQVSIIHKDYISEMQLESYCKQFDIDYTRLKENWKESEVYVIATHSETPYRDKLVGNILALSTPEKVKELFQAIQDGDENKVKTIIDSIDIGTRERTKDGDIIYRYGDVN